MGLIIAIREVDRVHFGADSSHVMGVSKSTFLHRNNFKFWPVRGAKHSLMAYVGPFKRIGNLLRVEENLFPDGIISFASIVKRFVPHVVELTRANAFSKTKQFDLQGRFILAQENRLYIVESDGTVFELNKYVAIGTAKRNAYGSLRTSESVSLPADQRIIKAIETALEDDYKVDFPIVLSSTKEEGFRIVIPDTTHVIHDTPNTN
jgi:ATP-dependent protease HslVU (ClpYQ) peptidase subunit